MPEFILEGRDTAVREESPFVLGFIEAMFFTESSPAFDSSEWFSDECKEAQEAGTADGTLPGDVGYCDLHPESLKAIRQFCEAFQKANAAALEAASSQPGYDETQAGRDLWFTSQGHGVGYWDRRELETFDRAEYDRLTGAMVEVYHSNRPEWEALKASRDKIESESIGQLLTKAAQYRELSAFFGDHVTFGDAPFVHVDF